MAATAAPAQREEARRRLGRPLSRPGSRRATGSTARQTWKRVLDSPRHRPSRPSGVPHDSWRGLQARARSSDTARTTPPRNRRQRARTQSSRPRTCRRPHRRPTAASTCTAGIAGFRARSGRRDCARGRVGQPMMVIITRVEPRRRRNRWLPVSRLNARLDRSPQRRGGHASTDRSTPRGRHPRPARRPAHEQRT
jgi:hypothetical protein